MTLGLAVQQMIEIWGGGVGEWVEVWAAHSVARISVVAKVRPRCGKTRKEMMSSLRIIK